MDQHLETTEAEGGPEVDNPDDELVPSEFAEVPGQLASYRLIPALAGFQSSHAHSKNSM